MLSESTASDLAVRIATNTPWWWGLLVLLKVRAAMAAVGLGARRRWVRQGVRQRRRHHPRLPVDVLGTNWALCLHRN